MANDSTNTTNNVDEYWGLVHGLRQAKASGHSSLHVVGDSAIVLSQLQTSHRPRKPHQVRLIADDIGNSSWGHHYRAYNQMADRLANIAINTGASIQEHVSAEANIMEAATASLDNDINHCLETSHAKIKDLKDPKDP